MNRHVPVFFDFACPWSLASRAREKRLARELNVEFEYLPWEIAPDVPKEGRDALFPTMGNELQAFAREAGAKLPARRERDYNTHRLLAGIPFARAHGREQEYVDAGLKAHWELGLDSNADATLRLVAREAGLDADALLESVDSGEWDAYLAGVDALGEKLQVPTTVTYVFKAGGNLTAYQSLGTTDEVRNLVTKHFDA